jgi:hypothetical protein
MQLREYSQFGAFSIEVIELRTGMFEASGKITYPGLYPHESNGVVYKSVGHTSLSAAQRVTVQIIERLANFHRSAGQ